MIDFDRTYRNQKALYDSFCSSTSSEESTLRKEFAALDEQLRIAFEKFADAPSFLSIIGEMDADRAPDEYWDAANKWYETELPSDGEGGSTHERLRQTVILKRDALMKQLAKAYKVA